MEDKLHDLKMLSLSSDPRADVTLDRHDTSWKPWTWFNGSEKVAPEKEAPTSTRISELETELTTTKAKLTTAQQSISSQQATIVDLQRQLSTAKRAVNGIGGYIPTAFGSTK